MSGRASITEALFLIAITSLLDWVELIRHAGAANCVLGA
jgi:hypothetical protein